MKTTLEIYDEVNCKFVGLDVKTRRKIVNALKFFAPYARHLPSYQLKRWDGMIAYATTGGRTYVNLLDRILPIIMEDGYEIVVDDRRSKWNISFDQITSDIFAGMTWPVGHPIEGQPVVLRDYQVEVVNNFLNDNQALQEVATGAGKTLITATLSKLAEKFGRTVTIVPNKSLVEQTEEDFKNLQLDVGVYYGDRKEWNHQHTICTWQSLNVLDKNSKDCLTDKEIGNFLENVNTVIVDECFAGDTKILTPNGTCNISEIKSGDKVINFSQQENKFKEDRVVQVFENLTKSSTENMLRLTFDNGQVIEVTANHQFLTNKGWIRADLLDETMDIINTVD